MQSFYLFFFLKKLQQQKHIDHLPEISSFPRILCIIYLIDIVIYKGISSTNYSVSFVASKRGLGFVNMDTTTTKFTVDPIVAVTELTEALTSASNYGLIGLGFYP